MLRALMDKVASKQEHKDNVTREMKILRQQKRNAIYQRCFNRNEEFF